MSVTHFNRMKKRFKNKPGFILEGSILWRECQDSDRIGATRTEPKNEKKIDEDELKRKSSFF